MVTLDHLATATGPDTITVFTDDNGRFAFPGKITVEDRERPVVMVKALGHRLLQSAPGSGSSAGQVAGDTGAVELMLIMEPVANQAGSAPASAWLRAVPDSPAKAVLITSCVNCHQVPTPEMRDFAESLNNVRDADPDLVRDQGWHAIAKYMRFRFARALARGFGPMPSYEFATDPAQFLPNSNDEAVLVEVLRKYFPRHSGVVEGYDYGAPLAVSPKTVIRGYRVGGTNAIREAVSVGTPPQIWIADFFGDRLVRIDVATGTQKDYPVPFDGATGPHTLVRGADGSLWVSMLFNSILGRLDPVSGDWRLWPLWSPGSPAQGGPVVVHDMAYDANTVLSPDTRGRIWNTDIANNALVSLDPTTGAYGSYPAPGVPGRTAAETQMYGIAMSSDRRHLWYAQLWGNFGSFNTETLEYETVVQEPIGAGPRRPAITEDDILYVPLFGAGQIVEYDVRARRQVAVYDLPDRASGPYAVTWDPKRKVLWVPTSNSDVIYRFDPAAKTFGVIPLPGYKAFLRMLAVDPRSGELVSSFGNLPEDADGPRMVLVIEPGDGVREMAAR